MNDLTLIDVGITQPVIQFPAYKEYLKRARALAEYIDSIELTDDNITVVKKRLAEARKVVDTLEKGRKSAKKEVLKPYEDFEKMVKNITSTIMDADANLRAKVYEAEQKERDEKEENTREIWCLRIQQYTFQTYLTDPFNKWLEPHHLNKSESMNKVEADMVAWMEEREKDVEYITGLQSWNEVIIEYDHNGLKLTEAVKAVEDRHALLKALGEREEVATFIIRGKQAIALAELLLKTNEIEFERK